MLFVVCILICDQLILMVCDQLILKMFVVYHDQHLDDRKV
jgi:hypothetical protein